MSRLVPPLLGAWCALVLLAPGAAASGRDLWIKCRDTGAVGTNHSPQDYEEAILRAPGDASEYTGCLAMIKAAQTQAALGASGGEPNASNGRASRASRTSATPAVRDTAAPAPPAAAVTPAALGAALAAQQVDPAAQPAPSPDAAPPVAVDGKPLVLGEVAAPSLTRTLSLPLPIAALAAIALLWVGQAAGRFAATRSGSH